MWFFVRIAACSGLVAGYGLLLVLALRHRTGTQPFRRLLGPVLMANAAFSVGLGLAALFVSGYWWSHLWQRAAELGVVALALLMVGLADAFVARTARRWVRLAVVGVLVAGAIALDALYVALPTITLPGFSLEPGRTETATLLLVLAWGVATLPAWRTALTALRRVTGSKHRNRIRYLVVCVVGLGLGDLLILFGGSADVYVGLVTRLLAFSVITFAVLRYDLPDMRRYALLAARIVVLSLLTAALYLVFIGGAYLLSGAVSAMRGWAGRVAALAAAVVVAAVIDVVARPRLDVWLDRTMLGHDYDPQKALRLYSQQMTVILDVERVADVTLQWLRSTFGVDRVSFLLLKPQSGADVEVSVLRSTNGAVPPPAIFGGEGRFLGHFERLAQPLSQYDMDMLTWFQTMPDAERAWLKELGVDLYVPVLLSDGPVALLALGPKAGARAYSEEDLETLTLMAHQTATAFKNTRLMDDLRAVQGDLRRLNVELSETNRQLMRLDRAKADFVTIASHELRTPLSQIFGYSDVLSSLQTDQLGDSPVFHEFVEGITRGARRLKDVVDAMVDMSLIETGGLTINCFLVSLSQVVKNAASVVEPRAQARAQTIAVEDLSALPNVEVDSARLQQVFESLLANAIKFSPDGGTITVSGRCDQDHIEVCVADQGIGIDPDHHDLVFEKFYRPENPLLHSTDDVAFKGAGPGLGLAIAKGIVEAHGGRIWVTSPRRDEERCPGSVFHVELPLVAGKAE